MNRFFLNINWLSILQ